MRKTTLLICSITLLCSSYAKAEIRTDISTALSPTAGKTEPDQYKDLKFFGYIDGSYNRLTRNYFTGGAFDRSYDVVPNGFTLQQAALNIGYLPHDGFGFLLNPTMGRDANFLAQWGFTPSSEFDSQTFAVTFPQAYVQAAQGPLDLEAGTFISVLGYETVDPTLDYTFSRGILYYASPTTLTGVRGTYTINDHWSVTAGLNNGWDSIRDWGRRKTVELAATWVPCPVFSITMDGLNGQERSTPRTDTGPIGTRTELDVYATLNVTDKLAFAAQYDNGWQSNAFLPVTEDFGKASWQGLAGWVNYTFNAQWNTELRGEIFEDSNGFITDVRQNWREVTVALSYIPIKNTEIRGEIRHDFSNQNAFTTSQNVTHAPGTQSYALEGFYKFG